MPHVTVQTANRIYLTKAEAILITDALNILRNTLKPTPPEVNGIFCRFQDLVENSDWSPTEN